MYEPVIKSIFVFSIIWMCTGAVWAAELQLTSDSPYERMGVDPNVSDEQLNKIWRSLNKRLRTDAGTGGDLTGDNLEILKIVNEAKSFLDEHRREYDQGLFQFNGVYKKSFSPPVPISQIEEENFKKLYGQYLWWESAARMEAGPNAGKMPAFLLYAILNFNGDKKNYGAFKPFQLRAYKELVAYLGLMLLTKSERAGILLRDPVQALDKLLEHYDALNIRLSTLHELFFAYNTFYLEDPGKVEEFVTLFEKLSTNNVIWSVRYEAIRKAAVKSLKKWIARYYEQPRYVRRNFRPLYIRTKKLVSTFETFPRSWLTYCQLLLTIKPQIDDPF